MQWQRTLESIFRNPAIRYIYRCFKTRLTCRFALGRATTRMQTLVDEKTEPIASVDSQKERAHRAARRIEFSRLPQQREKYFLSDVLCLIRRAA